MDGSWVLQHSLLTTTNDIEMEGILCVFGQLIFIIFFNNLDDAIQNTIIKSWDDIW